jgi:hypothetical protein
MVHMNDSREQLASMGNLAAETPARNGQISPREAVEQHPAPLGLPPTPAAKDNGTVLDARRVERQALVGAGGYAALELDFCGHHETNSARRRGPYEHYRLVYRYGYDLGTDPRYRDAEWGDVAQAARPRWEERNPGTWALFQETIRYAWDKARRLGLTSL